MAIEPMWTLPRLEHFATTPHPWVARGRVRLADGRSVGVGSGGRQAVLWGSREYQHGLEFLAETYPRWISIFTLDKHFRNGKAKTVGEDERPNAERRALFVGLWPPTIWLIGDSLGRLERRRRRRRRVR